MSTYKNFSADLAKDVERSKKDKRLESKKKKALAFLKLIEMKQDVAEESAGTGPPSKIVRRNDSGSRRKGFAPQSTSCFTVSTVQDASQQNRSKSIDEEYVRAKQAQRNWQKSTEDRERSGRAQQKTVKYGPSISVNLSNLLPFANFSHQGATAKLAERLPPLFIHDLQHLLLLAVQRNFSFWTPRWCRLVRPRKLSSVVLVVLQGLSIEDFEQHTDSFPALSAGFHDCVEMVSPTQYNSCVDQDLCAVPLSISQMKRYTKRKDVREKIFRLIFKPAKMPKSGRKRLSTVDVDLDPEEGQASGSRAELEQGRGEEKRWEAEDEFPRTSLLLSSLQLMTEGYPLPVDTTNRLYADYVFSKEKYAPVTLSSPMFAVDCEMCQTREKEFELTRVSMVNEQKEVLYDQLVKPYNCITNYLTRYSGVTAELLAPVTKRVEDVRREIRDLLPPDAILCGQSLWNDLNALKMFHPYVIDTSIIFNQSGDRKIRCGLRKLAFSFLGRSIQASQAGHCSIEDARATMDLVKLKLSKDIEFGDAMLGGVYFPDIKTYFQSPSQAQNVEETFASHPVPTLTDSASLPQSSSASHPACTSHPAYTSQPSQSLSTESCGQSSADDSVTTGRNGVFHETELGSEEGMQVVEPGSDKGEKERQKKKDQNKEGIDGNKELIDGNKEGIDGNKEGTDQAKDGTDQAKEGTDQAKEGTDQAKEGIDGNKEEIDRSKEEMFQREVFFQQDGSTKMFNIFEVFADNKISTGVVGSRRLVSRLHCQPGLTATVTSDNAEACAEAVHVHRDKDFTWLELTALADPLSSGATHCEDADTDARKRKMFSQVDQQVGHFVTQLQERTLVTVVMTGRYSQGRHLNAATFVKIT